MKQNPIFLILMGPNTLQHLIAFYIGEGVGRAIHSHLPREGGLWTFSFL